MCWKTSCVSHRDCRWRGKFIPGTNTETTEGNAVASACTSYESEQVFPTNATCGDKAGYKTVENLRACILSKFREPNCCSQRKTMHCEFPDSQEAMQGLLTGCHNILNCCLIAQIQQRCSILSAALWKFTETTHNVQSCHIRKRFHSLGPTQKRQLTKTQFFT